MRAQPNAKRQDIDLSTAVAEQASDSTVMPNDALQDGVPDASPATPSAEWYSHVISPWAWRKSANQAACVLPVGFTLPKKQAGGFFVECDEPSQPRSYLKPLRPRGDGYEAAAREKIAADLAKHVGVSVPPVLLWVRNDAGEDEKYVSISRVMAKEQWSWAQMKAVLAEENEIDPCPTLAEDASRAFVFNIWLDQRDHNDHATNIVWGQSETTEDSRFYFLDYTLSMGNLACGYMAFWSRQSWKKWGVPRFPPLMKQRLVQEVVEATVDAVACLDSAVLENIVMRIPRKFLPPKIAREILRGLRGRQKLVDGWVRADLRYGRNAS